jgi:hypothetical protein
MIDNPKERWQELCALAAKEQDSERLLALVREINRLFEEKDEARLHPKRESRATNKCPIHPHPSL